MLVFDNVLCTHLDNILLLYTDFYITFHKLQAPLQGHTEIPGRVCHSHRNWATKFNLAGHARTFSMTQLHMHEGFSHLNEMTDNCDVITMTSLSH